MPVELQLSRVFDKNATRAMAHSAVKKAVREYAALVPRLQVESKPTGRLYRRKSGKGFRRSHRASASGQKPAVDTGKLLKSTKGRMTGQLTGQVVTFALSEDYVDYAAILEFDMNRPIQHSPEDVKAAQDILDRNAERALRKLNNG